jgi:hypothetical protein
MNVCQELKSRVNNAENEDDENFVWSLRDTSGFQTSEPNSYSPAMNLSNHDTLSQKHKIDQNHSNDTDLWNHKKRKIEDHNEAPPRHHITTSFPSGNYWLLLDILTLLQIPYYYLSP